MVAFQTQRGLHVSGSCDEPTWLALIEAGWELGDRLLMLNAPMLRGDDVADLQRSLNHLGFDCGRPDGIFGPAAGPGAARLPTQLGAHRRRSVRRRRPCARCASSAARAGRVPGVASIREAEAVRAPTAVNGLRIVVGQFGGLSSIARSLSRALREQGATVMSTDEYEAPAQAAAANRFGADAYIGFDARTDQCSIVSYFAVPSFESDRRALARGTHRRRTRRRARRATRPQRHAVAGAARDPDARRAVLGRVRFAVWSTGRTC